jgi:hypothetical protein
MPEALLVISVSLISPSRSLRSVFTSDVPLKVRVLSYVMPLSSMRLLLESRTSSRVTGVDTSRGTSGKCSEVLGVLPVMLITPFAVEGNEVI